MNLMEDNDTFLHAAIEAGQQDIIEPLLEKQNINIDIKHNQGDTPLHIATSRNNEELPLLLNKNTKIDVKNNEDKPPLELGKELEKHYLLSLPENLFSKIDVPADGSCLFWAAALAYLIPVKFDDSVFKERFERLFGRSNPTELGKVQDSIKAYCSFSNGSSIRNDKELTMLVTEKFRNRVTDELSKHQSKFEECITVHDLFYSRNESYLIDGKLKDRFCKEFSSEIMKYNIDIGKLKPITLNEGTIKEIDCELDKIPDENKIKNFKFKVYVECMQDPSAWGGNHEIQAISQILRSNILVFSEGTTHSISYADTNDQIQLFNNGESHYNFGLIKAQTLIEAIKYNKQHEAMTYLNLGIDNIDYQYSQEYTPLHFAAQYGNTEITQKLLAQGARTDAKKFISQTPLQIASIFKRNSVVDILDRHTLSESSQLSIQQQPCYKIANTDSITDKTSIEEVSISDHRFMEIDKDTGSRKRTQSKGNEKDTSRRSRISILDHTKEYAASGSKPMLHGNIFQLKLLMLFLKRGIDKGYYFRLATEMNAAEKFDDLVFEYENERKDGKVYRFLQAKHKQDESKRITVNDLLSEKDGEFSLQKYFISYRKILRNSEFKGKNNEIKDFILCTNIDLDANLQDDFEQVGIKDNILDIQYVSKKSKRLKLKIDHFSKKEKIISILKSTSDLNRLAKRLAKCVIEEKSIILKDTLFRSYHSALMEDKIVDIKNKKLHSDFIEDNNLTQVVKEFRTAFQEEIIKISHQNNINIWDEVKGKELKLSENFGKIFQLNINPLITNTEKFANLFTELISQQDKTILIKRETSKTGVIKDNIDKLAGHVLVFEGEGKNKKIKFSSVFLEAVDTSLPGNLQDFKNILKTDLGSKNIIFDQLCEYEFKINLFKTCEEGQQHLQCTLPNDVVTDVQINEFFEKLLFAVNQPNEEELGKIIKKELGKEFNNIDTKNVYSRFQEYMLDWMKEKKGRFISHEEGKEFFEKLKKEILGGIWFDVKDPVPLFTGRTKNVEELHEALQNGGQLSQIASVTGPAGVGKSELARKYISENSKDYDDNVCWLNADTYLNISESFRILAKDNIGISTTDEKGEEKEIKLIVKDVYNFFTKTYRKGLFVFDNAAKYKTVTEGDEGIDTFLPSGPYKPHVLITSRDKEWGDIKSLSLDVFTKIEAKEFIIKALKIKAESAEIEINELAEISYRLPLALQQAVVYINKEKEWLGKWSTEKFTISNYLELYKEKANELLNKPSHETHDRYTETVLTTWEVTVAKIKQKKMRGGEQALDILNIIAYLAPNEIPIKEIFTLTSLEEIIDNMTFIDLNRFIVDPQQIMLDMKNRNKEVISNAIELLNQYSMVNLEHGVLSLHRLVQQVTRIKLQMGNKEQEVLEKAFNLLKESYPYDEGKDTFEDHVKTRQLLPHLEIYLSHIDYWVAKEPEIKQKIETHCLKSLLVWLANGHGTLGNHQKQLKFQERVLEINEKQYGTGHSEVAVTLVNLGTASGGLGNHQKQKELLERALEIEEKHYGHGALEVAKTLLNLSSAYGALGNARIGKKLVERALTIMEKHYAPDHFMLAAPLGNLGNFYGDFGNPQKQKELQERALSIVEKHYGPNDIKVAIQLTNLGSALGRLGHPQKKKEMLERALSIKEEYYGRDHIAVASVLINLGGIDVGDHQKQKEFIECGLAIEEKYYGHDHVELARALVILGTVYGRKGNHQKEKELLERALKLQEMYYHPDNIDIAFTLTNLASNCLALGKHQKSKKLLERALAIKKKHYGHDHLEVASTLYNLGLVNGALNKHHRKIELLEQALAIQEKNFASDKQIANTLKGLCNAYEVLGNSKKLKKFLEKALSILQKNCGTNNHEVALILHKLSTL